MSARVISCARGDDLETAHRLMRTHEIHRLPVVDSRGRPIGILSLSDVINHWHGRSRSRAGRRDRGDVLGDSPPPRAHRSRTCVVEWQSPNGDAPSIAESKAAERKR